MKSRKFPWIYVCCLLAVAAAAAIPFIIKGRASPETAGCSVAILAAVFLSSGLLFRRFWLRNLKKVLAALPGGRWEGSLRCMFPLWWRAEICWDISADIRGRLGEFSTSGGEDDPTWNITLFQALPKWRDTSLPFCWLTPAGGEESLTSWETLTAAGLNLPDRPVPEFYRPLLEDEAVREALLSAFRLGISNVFFWQGGVCLQRTSSFFGRAEDYLEAARCASVLASALLRVRQESRLEGAPTRILEEGQPFHPISFTEGLRSNRALAVAEKNSGEKSVQQKGVKAGELKL